MLIECGGIRLGQSVLYNSPDKGWVPAIVETVIAPTKETDPPILHLVVLLTGYSKSTFERKNAVHGPAKGCWLLHDEVKKILEDPDKGRSPAELKQLEELRAMAQVAQKEMESISTEPDPAKPKPEKVKAAK